MEWYLKVLRQYADFTGRARRKEYWMFTLVSFVIAVVLGILDGVLGLQSNVGVFNFGLLGGPVLACGVVANVGRWRPPVTRHRPQRVVAVVRHHPGHWLDRAHRVFRHRRPTTAQRLRTRPEDRSG